MGAGAATGAGAAGAARSAVVTRPPIPVPVWPGVYASEPRAPAVTPGPAAMAAATSRSMIRPCGPVPTPADCTEMPAAFAAALARGDAGASSAETSAGVATAVGAAGSLGAGAAAGSAAAGAASAAGADGVSTVSPGAPMMAMGLLTGTSSPSSTRSARTVPATPAGTSMVDLSVSMSHSTVLASTVSPTFTCQAVIKHDSTVLPSWGMTTVVAM